ncbi:MAG: hypothetical protein NCW75_00160 [Phycisphaera sp.]|nr:MAG: hypothetical protein NCW75_00160 [Phycisphaera sp.]
MQTEWTAFCQAYREEIDPDDRVELFGDLVALVERLASAPGSYRDWTFLQADEVQAFCLGSIPHAADRKVTPDAVIAAVLNIALIIDCDMRDSSQDISLAICAAYCSHLSEDHPFATQYCSIKLQNNMQIAQPMVERYREYMTWISEA